jgi:hypothetical protein
MLLLSRCTAGLMLTYRGLGLTGAVVVPSFTLHGDGERDDLGRPPTRFC